MNFLDNFKGKHYKEELEQLKQEHETLKSFLTPEMQDAFTIKEEITKLKAEQ